MLEFWRAWSNYRSENRANNCCVCVLAPNRIGQHLDYRLPKRFGASAPNRIQQTSNTQDGCYIGHARQFVFNAPVWKTKFEYQFVTIWDIWREETVSDLDSSKIQIPSQNLADWVRTRQALP